MPSSKPIHCCGSVSYTPFGLFTSDRTDCCCGIHLIILNVLASPILLLWHSFRIYVVPCILSSIAECCCIVCFTFSCCDCFLHKDRDFPPNQNSIGRVKYRSPIQWQRAKHLQVEDPDVPLEQPGKVKLMSKLFDKGYQPDDVCQGALGDCWLLSAIASLAHHPHTLQEIFISKEFNPRGKYTVKLWDACCEGKQSGGKWVTINVDDYIPVDERTKRPIFVQPRGNELWVVILEKVFAKFMGSYAGIEGGHSLFAMNAITGDLVNSFRLEHNSHWKRLYMQVSNQQQQKQQHGGGGGGSTTTSRHRDASFYSKPDEKLKTNDEMYDLVKQYHRAGHILAAGSNGTDYTLEEGRGSKRAGIVPGHAYTVLQVYEPLLTMENDIKLLKIRNPWGTFEWDGDWSDNSPLWDAHPQIRLEMGHNLHLSTITPTSKKEQQQQQDGVFYMNWSDFLRHFNTIDVCFTERNMSTLHLQVVEECGICGPCVGCVWGCIRYWLCCFGLYHLWCARESKYSGVQRK